MHISRLFFDKKADLIKEMLLEAPQDHQTAKKNALVRDGFRCVVTGSYDRAMTLKSEALLIEAKVSGVALVTTQCAHIFSESTNANIFRSNGNKEAYAASVWTIMKSFGYTNLPEDLNGVKVHRLKNIMTMSFEAHQMFDQLNLWFKETDTPNKYKLCAPHDILLTNYPKTVTFINHSDRNFPLPSPGYLKIHASCARIAHLSGAAEQIDKILEDMEDTKVLSQDGTSAEVLRHALLGLDHWISVC